MGHEIFISYSCNDKALVLPYVKQISEAVGKNCWIDLKGIESGVEFEDVIINAIDECQVVLFMLSDSSLNSKWTKREVIYAEDEGKRIVPVVIDSKGLRGWFKFHFGAIDYIDIHSKDQREKLISNLRGWLNKPVQKSKNNYLLQVEKVFTTSRGTYAYGLVEYKTLHVGDVIEICGKKGNKPSVITSIEVNGKLTADGAANPGQYASILLRGIYPDEVQKGDVIR